MRISVGPVFVLQFSTYNRYVILSEVVGNDLL